MRRVMLLMMVALAGLSACSGSGSSKASNASTSATSGGPSTTLDVNEGWAPADVASMRALALQLRKVEPQQCDSPLLLPRSSFDTTAKRLHVSPPKAVVDCTILDETAEMNLFHSSDARDQYVTARTQGLCKAFSKGATKLPALFWAIGGNYAIQFQHEGSARNIADAMAANYRAVPCAGYTLADVEWDPAGEARVSQLAAQLNARRDLKCTSNQLADYLQYSGDPTHKGAVPAAYSQCAGPGSSTIYLATFTPKTVSPATFISSATKQLCTPSTQVAAVKGDDFAILVTGNDKVARLAAVATGGTVQPVTC